MNIEMQSTDQIVYVKGVPARVWEGKTGCGVVVKVFVNCIAVEENENSRQFEKELKHCPHPGSAYSIKGLKLIL